MDKIARLPARDRMDLFMEAASRKGILPAVIEKDFWVCFILEKLFSPGPLSGQLLFKGGTSLSKVYGLIDRFSEDIDLVLKWDAITAEDPYTARSGRQQQVFLELQRRRAGEYVSRVILPLLSGKLGDICRLTQAHDNPCNVDVEYPESFTSGSLRRGILLEIGPVSSSFPNGSFPIQALAADAFPRLFESPSFEVVAIVAERTFWEKAVTLHREAHRENRTVPPRCSRHYYDVMKMARSEVRRKALNDPSLLVSVVDFVSRFYHQTWARYELARPGSFKLIPSPEVARAHSADYEMMKDMIYRERPSFEEILDELKSLESDINAIQAEG